MSIRYTLRHNIPADKVAAENAKYAHNQDPANVNDIQPYDFNLLRKYELAETTDHFLVFRMPEGNIVKWDDATVSLLATQLKAEIDAQQEALDEAAERIEALVTLANLTIDERPTAGSKNLVKSGGVASSLSSLNTALTTYTNERTKPITYVRYFPLSQGVTLEGEQVSQPKRPSSLVLNSSFMYGAKIGILNLLPTSGVMKLGKQSVPVSTSDNGDTMTQTSCCVFFGRIPNCMTKQDYEQNASTSDGLITFDANQGDYTNLLGLSVVQDYNSNTSSTPITVVPTYRTVSGQQYISGFRAIHDTSNAVTGYYIAIVGNQAIY